ncbi:MAG: hypothetical protein A2784_05095 [Candidatus Chisholmbacteria bacterium RIFCSPHIGHO2_01_FULL_48_12]|uniref:Ribonuclease VapC n=1 Tax=Candidatus Chisholmbacteria bacterium RIFCSPHIGHO2_01_FULL_48_12 TaxID=1797589 RepID=A0A1G1VRP8_9BACT|nr:MAG: hypothetical protein A2784_05095 [Candidatus Chisholmbacteria bacterium RIFCSPHIGHO2_01_FULL_48_12]
MRLIIDASVIVDYLRQRGKSGLMFLKLVENGEGLVISSVTVAELYAGKSAQKGGSQRERLDEMVAGMEVVMPDGEMAKRVGQAKYEWGLSLADAFVAALALQENLPLATLDRKAFAFIKELKFY